MALRIGWHSEIYTDESRDRCNVAFEFAVVSQIRGRAVVHRHDTGAVNQDADRLRDITPPADGIIRSAGQFDVDATSSPASPFVALCVRLIPPGAAPDCDHHGNFAHDLAQVANQQFASGMAPTTGDLRATRQRGDAPQSDHIGFDVRVYTDFGARLDGDIIVDQVLRSSERIFDMRLFKDGVRYRLYGGIGALATADDRRRAVGAASRRAIVGALGPFPFRNALHR